MIRRGWFGTVLTVSLCLSVLVPLRAGWAISIEDARALVTALFVRGTGFIVNENTVVTAAHVVQGCRKVGVRFDLVSSPQNPDALRSKVVWAEQMVLSDTMDLAVLSLVSPIPGEAAVAAMDADALPPDGELVYFLGRNKLDATDAAVPTIGNGIVSLGLSSEPGYRLAIVGYGEPGFSGSPVLNSNGRVSGVVVSIGVQGGQRRVEAVTSLAIRRLLDARHVDYQRDNKPLRDVPPQQETAKRISVGILCPQ